MKRTIMAALAALAIAGAASAQGANPPKAQDGQQPQQLQQTTVTGKLEWSDGTIALRSGTALYYVPRIQQLVGFVKDLQEGSTVSVTGYARKIPYSPNSFLMPEKVSFNGKDYDFSFGQGMGMGQGMRGFGMGRSGMGQGGQFGPGCGMAGDWDGDGVREAPRGSRW